MILHRYIKIVLVAVTFCDSDREVCTGQLRINTDVLEHIR